VSRSDDRPQASLDHPPRERAYWSGNSQGHPDLLPRCSLISAVHPGDAVLIKNSRPRLPVVTSSTWATRTRHGDYLPCGEGNPLRGRASSASCGDRAQGAAGDAQRSGALGRATRDVEREGFDRGALAGVSLLVASSQAAPAAMSHSCRAEWPTLFDNR
jgi:hypothetical protein